MRAMEVSAARAPPESVTFVYPRLACIAFGAESEAARVAACRELLDRAYGKATQTIAGDPDAPLQVAAMIERPPRETREQWEARRAAKIVAGSV